MSEARVRIAVLDDVDNLDTRLRSVDRTEIRKNSGLTGAQALRGAFASPGPKKIYSIDYAGRVLGMFGVRVTRVTPYDRIGAPWMVCSDELLEKYRRRFLKEYPIWIADLSEGYTLLENYVYAKNEGHIRWIRWAGFELVEYIEEYGIGKTPFWRFQRRFKDQMILRSISKES